MHICILWILTNYQIIINYRSWFYDFQTSTLLLIQNLSPFHKCTFDKFGTFSCFIGHEMSCHCQTEKIQYICLPKVKLVLPHINHILTRNGSHLQFHSIDKIYRHVALLLLQQNVQFQCAVVICHIVIEIKRLSLIFLNSILHNFQVQAHF